MYKKWNHCANIAVYINKFCIKESVEGRCHFDILYFLFLFSELVSV